MLDQLSVDGGKLATDVTTKLLESGIRSCWNKVKKHFKDCDIKEDIDLGIAYEAYLEHTKEKYGKIKTLIYKRIKEDLYSFYVHVKLKYGDKEIDSSNINNIIELTKKIIITGTGGIGKSTLMHHLFLNTIEQTDYIPVLIELRSLGTNNEVSIRKAIYEALTNNGFTLEDEYYEYSLQEGGYIFLFDGYDELSRNIVERVSQDIQCFSDKYSKNHFIISSRPSLAFRGWNDYNELVSLPLSQSQAIELISKIKYDETIKNNFLAELNNGLFDKHKSFAQNPLLLTIMLLTYESNAKIPESLNDFYERAFLVLFSEHDAAKDGYQRDTRTKLNYTDFKSVFSYICFISYLKKEYEFTDVSLLKYLQNAQERFSEITFDPNDFQQDLLQHVCMLVKDGLCYRFVHRSFQEYFAAFYSTNRLIDDEQNKVFKIKLSEDIIHGEAYYKMLFDMQPERFIHNILLPGLQELKLLNGDEQFSYTTLELLYNSFMITEIEPSKKLYISMGIDMTIDNSQRAYLNNILSLTSRFLNLPVCKLTDEQTDKIDLLIKKHFRDELDELDKKDSYMVLGGMPLDELKRFNSEEFNLVFSNRINQFTNTMGILKKYTNPSSEELSLSDLLSSL